MKTIYAMCVALMLYQGTRIGYDWYSGVQADWYVWFAAIIACVMVGCDYIKYWLRA